MEEDEGWVTAQALEIVLSLRALRTGDEFVFRHNSETHPHPFADGERFKLVHTDQYHQLWTPVWWDHGTDGLYVGHVHSGPGGANGIGTKNIAAWRRPRG